MLHNGLVSDASFRTLWPPLGELNVRIVHNHDFGSSGTESPKSTKKPGKISQDGERGVFDAIRVKVHHVVPELSYFFKQTDKSRTTKLQVENVAPRRVL
jgi:hypothetical protein